MRQTRIEAKSLEELIDRHAAAFDRYEQILLEENAKYNLTRITAHDQVRVRHWLDSLTSLPILDELADRQGGAIKLIDVGSGAGLPGLVLAIVRPAWNIISVEATDKKVRFQQLVCSDLKLANVTVLHGRAEELAQDSKFRERFDAVTARAVGALPILAELTLAFLREDGRAIYWKGPGFEQELTEAQAAIEKMGAAAEFVQTCTLPLGLQESAEMSLIVCKKEKPAPPEFPRVFGLIKKQPITAKKKK